jgi:hypothetical protein
VCVLLPPNDHVLTCGLGGAGTCLCRPPAAILLHAGAAEKGAQRGRRRHPGCCTRQEDPVMRGLATKRVMREGDWATQVVSLGLSGPSGRSRGASLGMGTHGGRLWWWRVVRIWN